ncbi:MAG TPA: tyrosine-type recombinase/integrase [Candidatus Bathyarchaeia archaeon]|nr:tyrosine-type recombinase/integrase [Candidatus Bathyarchaeia archaeon]
MTGLRAALADYLALRRALGYKLAVHERLLGQFLDFLEAHDAEVITTALAVRWATLPSGASPGWLGQRLSAVRGFAAFAASVEEATQIPPAGCLPGRAARAVPYLYSDAEVEAIMAAARSLRSPLLAHTYEALIGLLAVSGVRISEAIRLGRDDVLLQEGWLRVIEGKLGKSREVPLAPGTVQALRRFTAIRDQLCPAPRHDSFFCSTTGTRLTYARVRLTFSELCKRAGVTATSPRCRPRLHDFRHRFAVETLVSWQEAGADVGALLPLLSTVMGHVNPASTYWYLTCTPGLMVPVAARLEATFEAQR